MLQLDSSLDLNGPTVELTPLPYISHFRPYCKEYSEVDVTDTYDTKCLFYGYGDNRFDNETNRSGRLKRTFLPIYHSYRCKGYDMEYDAKSLVCSSLERSVPKAEKNYQGFIEGDFGGPILCARINVRDFNDFSNRVLVGIASKSTMFQHPTKEDLFVMLNYFSSAKFFRDWIEDNSHPI